VTAKCPIPAIPEDSDVLGSVPVTAHQAALEGQLRQLAGTVEKVRGLRAGLAQGQAPAAGELVRLLEPAAELCAAFDLPWPWGGERFELRGVRPLTYIGPLGSVKTRLARRLAEVLPGAAFLSLDRLADGGMAARARLLHGPASFELDPPDAAEVGRRRTAVLAGDYPCLVAEDGDGTVLGYAYASAYRTRPAYRFAVEDSVYVAPGAGRRGVGRALLPALLARLEAGGWRQVVAVIGDSGNLPSIGLHRACGFRHAGVLPAVDWKHGRWVDSVLMTRPLGPGADVPPPEGR